MDHAIEYLIDYMQFDKSEFIKEWTSGDYEKISECPSYNTVKTYCEAINLMSKFYCNSKYYSVTPNQIIKEI